jgi:hypothetical protein
MRKMLFAAASAVAVLSLDVHAQAFIGAAGGVSDWPNDVCSAASSSCDHRGGTWLVRGGYMFMPYIGIEARYVDLGRTTSSIPSAINGVVTSTDTHFESKGGAIGAVAALPVSPEFAFVAVAGFARLKTSFDTPETSTTGTVGEGTVTTPGFHSEDTNTNPYFGVGVDYLVARNLTAGVEATRYRVKFGGTENVDTFTASLTYHFR